MPTRESPGEAPIPGVARLPGPSPLEATALPTALSGTTATLTLSNPLSSPVGNGTSVFLAREGVVAYGTVSGSTATTLTVTLGSSCVQALSQGGTSTPVRVFLLKEKSLGFDPNRRVFTLTEGNRSLSSEPVPTEVAFGYVYGEGSGEVLLTAPTPNPGVLLTQGGRDYLLRAIVLRTVGSGAAQGAIARIPVTPLGTGICAPGASSTPPGGLLTITLTGPDSFFDNAYASAPDGSKTRVEAGSTTVLPTVGTHTLNLGQGGTVLANPITATETVGGQNLTYTFSPNPSSFTFSAGSLSPFLPLRVTITFTPDTGRVTVEATGLPSSATWSGSYTGTGRYAESGSIPPGTATTRTLDLPPGVYTFSFADATRQVSTDISGTTYTYREAFPPTGVSPSSLALSSGGEWDGEGYLQLYPACGNASFLCFRAFLKCSSHGFRR